MIAGMVADVKEQKSMYNPDIQQAQKKIINVIKTEKQRRYSEELAHFKDEITDPTRIRLLEATLEAGSSNWLTTLPIKEHGHFTAKVLAECHTNVKIEPILTPLTGETFPQASTATTDEARVDIAARGVWVKGQMALFDVRVFNPIAKVYLTSDLPAAYRRNELEKKRVYGRRVRMVDQASFTSLIPWLRKETRNTLQQQIG